MRLKILTPERVVFDEDGLSAVYAKTEDGEFGILPGHLPMVAPLVTAILTYHKGKEKHKVAVMGGMFSYEDPVITVLCNAAELADEVDTNRAKTAQKRAQDRTKDRSTEIDQEQAQAAKERADVRLKLAGK